MPSRARISMAARVVAAASAASLLAGVVGAIALSGQAQDPRPVADAGPAGGGAPAGSRVPSAQPHVAPAQGEPAGVPARDSAAPTGAPLFPLPAAPAQPTGCPPRPRPPGVGMIPRPPQPTVAESRVPAPVRVPPRTVDLAAVRGTGIWVTVFSGGRIDAPGIVATAVREHLTSVWVRTGSSREGGFGSSVLADLLPLAHAHGVRVIAWDFATLSDPVIDARRLTDVLAYRSQGQGVDGVSPDIETTSEGVFLTGRRVLAYYSRVQALAGSHPVIGTVLRPTDYWWAGNYPYHETARYADAFAPMIYWSCNEPGGVTSQAVDRLRTLRPVHVVGQLYDMGPEYGRRGLPSPREVWRFLDVAKRRGAAGASFYLYSQARGPQLEAVRRYPWR